MGIFDSITGPFGLTFSSWAVKTPSPGHLASHSPHGQSRLHHRAIWPHILLMGSQDSITGPFGLTFSSWAVKTSSLGIVFMATHTPP
ncbi:hypothetical protein BgiMline_024412 [Biomphalaria glabrata]